MFVVKRDVLQGASCASAVRLCAIHEGSVLALLPAQKHQAE